MVGMKKVIRFTSFIIIVFILCLQLVFWYQEKNAHIEELYNTRNLDVLVLGSSHAYVNLSGAVMYDNYGLAASSVAQAEQQIRMSYYTLESALRYCSPKVVVFEVYMAVIDDEYGDMKNQYADAMLSFPFFGNLDVRLSAIDDLKGTNYISYILGAPLYHNDYKKIFAPKSTKKHTAGFMNAFFGNKEELSNNMANVDMVTNSDKIGIKSENALIQTINLCKKKDIDLVLVVTPYKAPEEHMKKLKTVQDIAYDYEVPFVDMNCYIDEIGIDMKEDMYDWGHSNNVGAEKNSVWFGNWLLSNYSLDDHRSDADYKYWELVSQERREWENEGRIK